MAAAEPNQSLLWTEAGCLRRGPVAEVALTGPLDRAYSYLVPEELASRLAPGQRVRVPVGRKNRPETGFCLSIDQGPWTTTIKPVLEVLDPVPLLDESLLELGRWISSYYLCPLGRTLAAMVPEAAKSKSGFRRVKFVAPAGPVSEARDIQPRLTAKQQAVLAAVADADSAMPVAQVVNRSGSSAAVVNGLVKRGLLHAEQRLVPAPAPDFDLPTETPDYQLNRAQVEAVKAIEPWLDPPRFRVGLLYGVSGSGKTEVYVQAIRKCLDAGRQAIVLVPEIALTSQTAPRLARRFKDVAILHSGLKGSGKSLTWHEIAAGKKTVIIGTRSAVFAPCPVPGLIVVDEEQEASFKNQQAPRYHARDVAIKRAQLQSIPVLLGSATPSLETWLNAGRLEHFELLRLPDRVAELPMPEVRLVDMRDESGARPGLHLLSRPLEAGLRETLGRGEQAVLLLNRRGFATMLFCSKCGQRICCPRCGTNMVYHQASQQAICHYCSAAAAIPPACPDVTCRGKLIRRGMGTQRIEQELLRKFPDIRLQRVDSDTMQRAADYKEVIAKFEAREIDVLLGTQMIAKGLDFPYVSFVGVISADTALALPDFRAAERTFQLVTQVAGRAGRSRLTDEDGGLVVLQSFAPDAPAIQAAVRQSFEEFAEGELRTRRALGLPPYARLIRIVLEDPRDSRLAEEADGLAERIRGALAHPQLGARVGGPTLCPLRRIRNLYRRQVLLSLSDVTKRAEVTRILQADKLLTAKVKRLIVDCDPVSLM
jgi:primosomal protein N' (replication factor Y)